MRLLITGATGFIGRRLTQAAIVAGHEVTALVRRDGTGLPCDILQCDLSAEIPRLLPERFDVVIHLAAALSGSPQVQTGLTVEGTRNLIAAMTGAGMKRLVGISSLAVIDYPGLAAGSLVDERAPGLRPAAGVGTYARSKAAQEALFREFGAAPGNTAVVLRPGLVYDRQLLSDAYAGISVGPLRLAVQRDGQIPVTDCSALAQCMLQAAGRSTPGFSLYHVLDDPLPDQRAYALELRRRGGAGSGIPLNWRWFRTAAGVGQLAAHVLPVPEVFTAQGFATRMKPFRYTAALARNELNWTPTPAFASSEWRIVA